MPADEPDQRDNYAQREALHRFAAELILLRSAVSNETTPQRHATDADEVCRMYIDAANLARAKKGVW